jgi:hypothetical protein
VIQKNGGYQTKQGTVQKTKQQNSKNEENELKSADLIKSRFFDRRNVHANHKLGERSYSNAEFNSRSNEF